MRCFVFIVIFLIPGYLFSQQSNVKGEKILSQKERMAIIKSYYENAAKFYSAQEYEKAIFCWEQILKIDPEQLPPRKYIEHARAKLQEKYNVLLKEVDDLTNKGSYKDAVELLKKQFGETGMESYLDKNVVSKLSLAAEIFNNCTGSDKVSSLIRLSVSNYLNPKGNPKTAINACIYASQLAPENDAIRKFLSVLEKEFSSVWKTITIIPGISFIEQKLRSALEYIYDAKYEKCIIECNEILELEPTNLLALKRLGSAYYALNKIDKAKEIWGNALKMYPNDDELKQFLKR
jgi:tetratricopeptide (TPR) repeat protein